MRITDWNLPVKHDIRYEPHISVGDAALSPLFTLHQLKTYVGSYKSKVVVNFVITAMLMLKGWSITFEKGNIGLAAAVINPLDNDDAEKPLASIRVKVSKASFVNEGDSDSPASKRLQQIFSSFSSGLALEESLEDVSSGGVFSAVKLLLKTNLFNLEYIPLINSFTSFLFYPLFSVSKYSVSLSLCMFAHSPPLTALSCIQLMREYCQAQS